jgi:hypothetical protein
VLFILLLFFGAYIIPAMLTLKKSVHFAVSTVAEVIKSPGQAGDLSVIS